MNFLRRQIKDILEGGISVFFRRIRIFPVWIIENIPLPTGVLKAMVRIFPGWTAIRIRFIDTYIFNGCFSEAFEEWEKAFAWKPDWPDFHSTIQNDFFFCGQADTARLILQRDIDHKNTYARENHLDTLGVRFLTEYPTVIGHTALLDSYIKMDKLGMRSSARPILLVHSQVANPCYLDYWRQYFPDMITDAEAIRQLMPIAKYLNDRIFIVMDNNGEQNMGDDYGGVALQADIQTQWEKEGRSHLLELKDSDAERGRDCLKKLGVPEDAWFVALHIREAKASLRAARDADISTYYKAIDSIVRRGGWVIRMGNPSMTPLQPMPQVIDYAHTAELSDWMDVFLWAKCRFFIGTQSGPAWVPPTFGVPCVATNWTFFSRRWYQDDLFIPKLFRSDDENRYLTFDESINSDLANIEYSEFLTGRGMKIVDNSAEDIDDVVNEMMDRLDGNDSCSEEDMVLQQKFNDIASKRPAYKANGKIGRQFLRKWSELLR